MVGWPVRFATVSAVNSRAPTGKKFPSRALVAKYIPFNYSGFKMEDKQGLRTWEAAGLCANKQRLRKFSICPTGSWRPSTRLSITHIICHCGQEPAGKRGPCALCGKHVTQHLPQGPSERGFVRLSFSGEEARLVCDICFYPSVLGDYLLKSNGCRGKARELILIFWC